MRECFVKHTSTDEKPTGIATKIISGGMKRSKLVDMILYDIHSTTVNDHGTHMKEWFEVRRVIKGSMFHCHYGVSLLQ